MKEFDAFTAKDLRTAERVIRILTANKFTKEQLFEFNKFFVEQELGAQERSKRKQGRRSSGPRPPKKSRRIPLLKPGETEQSNMLCGCGGKLLIEGMCGMTANTKGYVRLCICMNCNKEFKIR